MFNWSRNAAATHAPLVHSRLRTPRAAAIAGIVFSVLFMSSLAMLWRSLPADPRETGHWLNEGSGSVSLALSLLPFAGIAFFWFLGVLRDRLGEKEDKFFATVFFGSGLLFLGMMFVAATAMGALIQAHAAAPDALPGSAAFAIVRAFTYDLMHIYALKMAAVFMITTSTLAINTQLTPRWIALLGYACALFLLVGNAYLDWVFFIFPSWVLLVSVYVLKDNLWGSPTRGNSSPE
jgi:MFS family permease